MELGFTLILKIHAILSASFEHALKLGIISRNPAKLTMPPQKPVKEMKFLDESQVSQLLIAAQGIGWRDYYNWPWQQDFVRWSFWACSGLIWTGSSAH